VVVVGGIAVVVGGMAAVLGMNGRVSFCTHYPFLNAPAAQVCYASLRPLAFRILHCGATAVGVESIRHCFTLSNLIECMGMS
jgi:hypothetical protein